ncbi:unnamed protein product [marine sediment metagenome]|uniref:Uncharacterized protein n=1 Tax=marine sediment metagenome TaxID=412755 RepID=X1JYD3_9ZZZZ
MRCPECEKNGLKSKVYVGTSSTTLLASYPYYDEEGNYHCDDPNTITTSYSCSNGHSWSESS